MMDADLRHMRLALSEAAQAAMLGEVPVGVVVVRGDEVIAMAGNRREVDQDPTAHAEIVAIRKACQALQHFELTGCEIYCSCEPCPMCLGAIYWARPEQVFFAAPGTAAADAGFDDTFIKQQICLPYQSQQLRISQLHHDQALAPFRAWKAKPDKIAY